jgi:exonuclease III
MNGLNSPIKRHRLKYWLHKQDTTFCCIQETHFNNKEKHYLRVRGWKKDLQANCPKKQAGVAILIFNKIDFQPKVVKHDEEGYVIFIKGKNPPREKSQF